MKRKLIALVTALTLCAAVVVGTTLAYYSAQTADKTNTFTYSPGEDPGPTIIEPNWPDDPTITPEKIIPKDPQVRLTNENAKLDYYVAMVIKGDSPYGIDALNSLGKILMEGTESGSKTIYALDDSGNKIPDPDNQGDYLKKVVTVEKNKGIATIYGWNASYTYQIDETTGTVYAYYTDKIGATSGNYKSTPVFEGVKMNKEIAHFFEGINPGDADKKLYDIVIEGYVVSSENDTKLATDGSEGYEDWGSCKAAMQAAFPTVFFKDGVSAEWTNAGHHQIGATGVHAPYADAKPATP